MPSAVYLSVWNPQAKCHITTTGQLSNNHLLSRLAKSRRETLSLRATDYTNPDRVSDECLCWHFHQSILTVVRGTGEPAWNEDVVYEDLKNYGDFEEDVKDLERKSVRGLLEWEMANRLS